jgi:hypothetical protein
MPQYGPCLQGVYPMRHASRIVGILGVLIAVVGCEDKREISINPFGGNGVGSIGFTMECVFKAENGECMKSQCKKSAHSDCTDYATACMKHDGYYAGSREGGTCSKVL